MCCVFLSDSSLSEKHDRLGLHLVKALRMTVPVPWHVPLIITSNEISGLLTHIEIQVRGNSFNSQFSFRKKYSLLHSHMN
jgi:hypothetical protein